MLKTENFTLDHIRTLKANSDSDPAILERTVYAFGLLESLVRVHMPFTFKGGTCLLLLLEKPRRLSNEMLLTEEPYPLVVIPSIDCILGDKLTAFVPHTTGIPFLC